MCLCTHAGVYVCILFYTEVCKYVCIYTTLNIGVYVCLCLSRCACVSAYLSASACRRAYEYMVCRHYLSGLQKVPAIFLEFELKKIKYNKNYIFTLIL